MTIASLGIEVRSGQAAQAAVDLNKLEAAAKGAENATGGLAAGARTAAASVGQLNQVVAAEAPAQDRATASVRMHTAALQAEANASKMASFQRRNLLFQLNDVGVSLASGMNPLMVAVQQGSQIATIYEGGVVPALKETAAMAGRAAAAFWPIGLAIGAVAAVLGGLTHEINETAKVQVGFFDVALAGWQLFTEGVAALVAPVFGAIGSWLQAGWDAAVPILKGIGNTIVGTFSFAVKAIGTLWQGLPAALGDVMITTANVIVKGVEYSINKAAELIDAFIGKANEGLAMMPGGLSIPNVGRVDFGGAANPFAGALGDLGSNLGGNAADAFGTDYMGAAFGALSARAQKIAAAKKEVEGIGGAAKAANDNVKKLADDGLKSAADRAQELSDNLGKSIGGALKSLIDGTKDFGTAMRDVLLSVGSFLGQQAAGIFGGMGGGMGFVGSILSGLFGGGFANGGVFSGGHVQPFANGGVVSRPTFFPMANGAGLMGEAGPEAIMPLRRGPDGRLGVSAANQNQARHVHVTVGIATDGNGNIRPFVESVSQQTVAGAAPAIVAASTAQSRKQAPAAVAQYQQQRGNSDYRTM